MTATLGAATSGSRPELIGATYRRLLRMGFEGPEAANLTALMNGFGVTRQPWTVWQLTHLLFLRERRCAGHRWSGANDWFHGTDGFGLPAPADRAPKGPVEDGAAVSSPQSGDHNDAGPADRPVTLLTLYRAIAGPNATLDLLRQSVPRWSESPGDADRQGG
jgi:hypothetical protein